MKAPPGPMLHRKLLLSCLFAASLCGCGLYGPPIYTGEKNMSEPRTSMQPVCVGRLVVEIPTGAKIVRWSQKANHTEIESVDTPSPTRQSFDAKIVQREKLLKSSPHETEGVLFKNRIRLTPDTDLLVYRKGASDTFLYQLDAPFWRPTYEYKFHVKAATEDLAEGIDYISNVVKSFIPMPTTDLTSLPPGLCIEHGVITGSEFRGESVDIEGRIDEYPDVRFSFSTESTSQPPEEPSVLERIESAFAMIGTFDKEFSASTRFLRKGKRKLNGQSGEEAVLVNTTNGKTIMDAKARFYGEPNSLDKPDIEVSLTNEKHDGDTHEPLKKDLTEKEFLALWDALLNGIKPRPKGLWGADSIKK